MIRIRKLRRFLSGPRAEAQAHPIIALQESFVASRYLVQFFYLSLVVISQAMTKLFENYLNNVPLAPVGYLSWTSYVAPATWVLPFVFAYSFGSLLAFCFPHMRSFRVLIFLATAAAVGLHNSYGKIGHSKVPWILATFVLIFLPSRKNKSAIAYRQLYVTNVFMVQGVLALAYSMAGWHKVLMLIHQWWSGEATILSVPYFANLVANARLAGGELFLGSWLFTHAPWMGPLLVFGMLYVESTAILFWFRPRLHRFYGCAMLVFHLTSLLLFDINFDEFIPFVGIFFVMSPFADSRAWEIKRLRELPGLAWLFRRFA